MPGGGFCGGPAGGLGTFGVGRGTDCVVGTLGIACVAAFDGVAFGIACVGAFGGATLGIACVGAFGGAGRGMTGVGRDGIGVVGRAGAPGGVVDESGVCARGNGPDIDSTGTGPVRSAAPGAIGLGRDACDGAIDLGMADVGVFTMGMGTGPV
jgi:hypothetical protein